MDETRYVMVPVPEDLVPDVMRHVLELTTSAAIEPWDEPALAAFLASLDEVARSVLSLAARASASGQHASVEVVADSVQLSGREVTAEVRALTARATEARRPALATIEAITRTLPNGRTTQRRVLAVEPAVAALVAAIEQAERNAVLDLRPGSPR